MTTTNTDTTMISREFAALMAFAKRVVPDLGPDLNAMLEEGMTKPLHPAEAEAVLTGIVDRLRSGGKARGDQQTILSLGAPIDSLVAEAMQARDRVRAAIQTQSGSNAPTAAEVASDSSSEIDPGVDDGPMVKKHTVHLLPVYNGIKAQHVVPKPVFHEKEVAMIGGFIKTTDLALWEGNERLEIHIGQFNASHGRDPSPEEILHIMHGEMALQGTKADEDEFDILTLARSIAANGVRKPPIIDIDGTLLDGNRRVAACMLVLTDNKEFKSPAEKRRAEYIYVWQLTPDATDDDRQKVIVSLNFESDCKKEWPEYIKARKIFEEWQAMLALEGRKLPGPARQAQLKRELSKKYALGPDSTVVTRYIKMVRGASEFEDHHINTRQRDPFAVQHAANRYFQYFDELAKGENAGGVAWSLNQDESFKATVYDLLFEGKFDSWRQIRELKHIYNSRDARDALGRALHESEPARHIEEAITIGNAARQELRAAGANDVIEKFVAWLLNLPPVSFRDNIRTEVLQNLIDALGFIQPFVKEAMRRKGEAVT